MECIQCIAKKENEILFARSDLEHYEHDLFRATLKKTQSAKKGLKHDDSNIEFTRTVSKTRLDESIQKVGFAEDKFGSKSILESSLNLDESVNFQRQSINGFSDARKPTDEEKQFFYSLKGDIERQADFKFDKFEAALVTSQNAGSIIYKVKISVGAKYIHAKVVRHAGNTFGGKAPEILEVQLNKYEDSPL